MHEGPAQMISRRKFLKLAGTGALTVLGSGAVPTTWSPIAIANDSNRTDREPDSIIKIHAVPGKVPIFSGPQTNVWRYSGEVLKDDPAIVTNMGENSYLGPVLPVNRGEKIRIIFQNSLPASSIIHWHGLINGRTFQMSTFADDEIVRAGTSEIWEFINTTRGRGMMGMQIPHPMHLHGAHFRVLKRS